MTKVLIMMSTYNGGDRIIRQVESILNQKNVDIDILIRDDGSDADTISVLNKLENEYSNIRVIYGENIGWKRSFLELVYSTELDFEYYGFSDQDDIWFEDKVISLVSLMENDVNSKPKLAHCNSLSVDYNLVSRKEQEFRTPCPPGFKQAIATEYFQGCGMLWNSEAMELIRVYKPKNYDLAHDYWVGLICYLFGEVYFCKESKFYHIRYEDNSSEDGDVWKGRMKRLHMLLACNKHVYMNPAKDLLDGYQEMLDDDRKQFLRIASNNTIINRINLLMDNDFHRNTMLSTISFKFALLVGRYIQ